MKAVRVLFQMSGVIVVGRRCRQVPLIFKRLLHNLWDGKFFAWLRKGNSCETCSLHTPSHGTTEPNMHLGLVQDIWAESLHLQGQGSWLSLCVWWTVDRARSYFQCAERFSCCSYRKQTTPKSCVSSDFETDQLQLLRTLKPEDLNMQYEFCRYFRWDCKPWLCWHVILQHERNSAEVHVFCAILRETLYGLFFFLENTVSGNSYMLFWWLLPNWKRIEMILSSSEVGRSLTDGRFHLKAHRSQWRRVVQLAA